MSERMVSAIQQYREATNAFLDVLEAEVTARWRTGVVPPLVRPTPGSPDRDHPKPAKAAMRVPPPAVKNSKSPGPELSDETRERAMKDARPVADKIVALLGPSSPTLLDALRGQLAIEHIPFDAKLLAEVMGDAITS